MWLNNTGRRKMSRENSPKGYDKKCEALIAMILKKSPRMAQRIKDGIRYNRFSKKGVVEYFTKCIKLNKLYDETDLLEGDIATEHEDVIEELCECEEGSSELCDEKMREIIYHLLDESRKNEAKKYEQPRAQQKLPTRPVNNRRVITIDGKELSPSEVAFQEFLVDNFDEEQWLKDEGLIF